MSVEDQLDRLINLIEMSVDLENPEKIQEIEKEIVQSFQELKVDLLNQTESKKNLAEEKLEKLKVLLVKLNKKQDAKKNFLDDFNNFLKNRKIN
jgi:cob(I)alamin adenosyltransferase|tara:strand:- start:1417 stop:1698 length:282 start_codon:yes stop_codon:yes gene_type:complete